MSFAGNLKSARLNSGMTQVEVAARLGVDKSTYSGYESGKRQPDVKRIKELSKILNASADFLIGADRAYPENYINRVDDRYIDALVNRPEIEQLLKLALSTSTDDVWRMIEIWRLVQRTVSKK